MISRVLIRGHSTLVKQQRDMLLRKVYAPFAKLEKDTPEYNKLALSGKVWEDFHQPADSNKHGYFRLQKEKAALLRDIDSIKESMKIPASMVAKQLVSEYAYQSVQIEDNRLNSVESSVISDFLAASFFSSVPLASLSAHSLCGLSLPDVTNTCPNAAKNQVIELRNHIVASQWIAEVAPQNPGTAGLGEDEVRELSALTMKGLDHRGNYPQAWGGAVRLGEYRKAPISTRSNPLRIFPYHVEVPACMGRFFQWRDAAHKDKKLHPLILACQATAYFLHIHPFPDGNGRVSRMLMHDYMVRQGYVPAVFQAVERTDYLRMMKNAQDGEPDEFVLQVLTNQLEALQTFKWQEIE
ncbi:fido domain-containing protein [Trichoderma austrokoningii]